ncbi:hypothetical protein HanIR_Chr14g0695491 [Helianthus annuus]|nr:hypothetical protein HanIR_Chr14g0695491 [Helianthus annuus]
MICDHHHPTQPSVSCQRSRLPPASVHHSSPLSSFNNNRKRRRFNNRVRVCSDFESVCVNHIVEY